MKIRLGLLAASLAFAFSANAQQQHQDKCSGMSGNEKDICQAEVRGQKKVQDAEAKVQERDTPKNRYDVAKQRCDDQVGDAKDACQQQAKAQRDQALAQAKMQSQSQAPRRP